ncbi:PREDICTED: uncharacterized protein LOC105958446 [Erythranthe guttata]|uniref:uncharacterized protein LOC105958446 n=1 Tax=Erythranthe guttata TaxID=4155 RepID=UPI00064DA54E|nr:PREDICTED: uncharacterized protein LOC105958446 [Erythranthe guttata]|eukprot:XP_012837906.1 PREDICTED: uncharacterized protein LOC105958446 [Erythranthe guttata]
MEFGAIDEKFWPIDRHRILTTPIGSTHANDRLVWHYSRSGDFTVKSCFHNIMQRHNTGSGDHEYENSSQSEDKEFWKFIWHLSIPPKIKIFIWRAVGDLIPANAALFRRHVSSNPFCGRCRIKPETTVHALVQCRSLTKVWLGQPFELNGAIEPASFRQWIEQIRKKLSKDLFYLAMIHCWKFWDSRNREAHGEVGLRGWEFCSWSENYLSVFRAACHVPPTPKDPVPRRNWSPPPDGFIKVNFDAALPPSQSFYRVSMVARNSEKVVLWWCVKKFTKTVQAVEGEAHAALKAIQMAKAKCWNSIILEGDCQQLITALRDEDASLSPFRAYLEDIQALISSFISCQFSIIPRTCNNLAHALANIIELATRRVSSFL